MLKKSFAIILSIALAMGILVHGSFAYTWDYPEGSYNFDDLWTSVNVYSSNVQNRDNQYALIQSYMVSDSSTLWCWYQYMNQTIQHLIWFVCDDGYVAFQNNKFYVSKAGAHCAFGSFSYTSGSYEEVVSTSNNPVFIDGRPYYYALPYTDTTVFGQPLYCNHPVYLDGVLYNYGNLDLGSLNPDTRYLEAYISGSTYGNVRFLAIQTDDVVLSSTWISIRYIDSFGTGTYIKDYPFDFVSSGGYSIIKINPEEISHNEFTVTSVLFSGSPSWGTKEIMELDLTFNEGVLPTPIPSVVPVPDYSYYDTTYINYNGGEQDVIYTPISCDLLIGYLDDDQSKFYFLDFPGYYLEQPFSYSFIVIPDIQYEYSSFLEDCIYQYDVVIDDFEIVTYNSVVSFDYLYGSGAWANLNGLLTSSQVNDVSSVLESWYSTHDPIIYQFPYVKDWVFNFDERQYDCSLIITDSFFFKQTNYLLGDTGDILSEFSDRFFKIDGFSDSLFNNISSLYNLNLQYYDSSLQALTGLSYWLNENDISSSLSDIFDLLSSVDSYLSSVDSKLNYLVTIDSDLNDLLEWFQNQEDSDVTLTLPDFNPSILIDYYGENIGDFVEFVQGFVDTLPSFDYSDFPNFFDYAADLVDDTAGSGDDLIGSLFQSYDYDDSGLHEFGWD